MEIFQHESRAAYLSTQITASTRKIDYCKFSIRDAVKYVELIRYDKTKRHEKPTLGPILCLGVRNGREVDCFRIARGENRVLQALSPLLERQKNGLRSFLPWIERGGRSSFQEIEEHSCIGVELNPLAKRKDVWIGSYDELPTAWAGKFEVVYTNALDHAFDPTQTIEGWKRVIRRPGYMILGYPQGQKPGAIDPTGLVTLEDVLRLFGGELIYFHRRGSVWEYTEFLIRLS